MDFEVSFVELPDFDGTFDADNVWDRLNVRGREVLRLRLSGHTLEQVAQAVGGVSRERARQLQVAAESEFTEYLEFFRPGLKSRLLDIIGDRCAVSDVELADIVESTDDTARRVALNTLGLSEVRIGDAVVPGWWTLSPKLVQMRVDALISQAPFLETELVARADELEIPAPIRDFVWRGSPRLRVVPGLGWVRRAREGRDIAKLWLTTQGEPRSAADIAAVVGSSEHAIRENMRRDPDFIQIRPEGTWALAQWNIPGGTAVYTNATEVIVDLLRDRGPIGFEELLAEARRVYPVGSWRYSQTFTDSRVGRTPDGRYDLTERGATPIEDTEPRRPHAMAESDNGRVIAVKLPVNFDLLRGSGINVNRWLTWRLGLRVAPTARRFELLDPPGEVTIRRNTSTASVSSLRLPVQEMGLVDGCAIVLVLRPESDTASLRHACAPGACPAGEL